MTALLLLLLGMLTTDPRLEALWREGVDFAAYDSVSTVSRDILDTNRRKARVLPPELLARARAVEGNWRFLVVAVDGCSDSVSSLPFLAALAESAGFELRIVDREKGRWLMEQHRTPDGRAATPTVVLLNDRFQDVGAWIERPAALQQLITQNPDNLERAQLFQRKMQWYADDNGVSTLREIVELLEKAAARVE